MTQAINKLTKTNYLQYLSCPEELWLQINRPDLMPGITMDALHKIEQGNLIDQLARQLFELGGEINGQLFNADQVIFQQKASFNNYLAIADITISNFYNSELAIFEVKASTQVKKEHLHDAAFQKMVFEKSGQSVGSCFLVYLNKNYIVNGPLDINEYLIVEDITQQVVALEAHTILQTETALDLINGPMPPKRITLGCANKLNCPFVQYHYPDLPAYSVYDIARIHKNKLEMLVTSNTIDILDVPSGFPLSDKQRLQVDLAQEDQTIIKGPAIKSILDQLDYPLYFLDYETFSYVLPPQNGYRPYQQMVFQYSLHTIHNRDTSPEHHEYLLSSKTESVENLIHHLSENIAPIGGSVIVWNKSFEIPRNKEMAAIHPQYADFLQSVNDRVYDLMDIFKDGLYLHPQFKGSYSIKKVLPVLCPALSYKSLQIQNGTEAVIWWHRMTDGKVDGKEQEVSNDLLKYCELDTWAMVQIWAVLVNQSKVLVQ